jgi:hypothetical protein
VKLNKTLSAFLVLARFAADQNLRPYDVAVLVTLANRLFKATVRAASDKGHDAAEDKARRAFEDKARELGYGADLSSPWPMLTKGEERIHLPGDEG